MFHLRKAQDGHQYLFTLQSAINPFQGPDQRKTYKSEINSRTNMRLPHRTVQPILLKPIHIVRLYVQNRRHLHTLIPYTRSDSTTILRSNFNSLTYVIRSTLTMNNRIKHTSILGLKAFDVFQSCNSLSIVGGFDAPVVEHGVPLVAQVEEMFARGSTDAATPGKRCGAWAGNVEKLVAGRRVDHIDAFEGAVVAVDFKCAGRVACEAWYQSWQSCGGGRIHHGLMIS